MTAHVTIAAPRVAAAVAPLADRYAAAKAAFDRAERELQKVKDEVLATGLDAVEGFVNKLSITHFEQTRLDNTAVKLLLTADQYASAQKKNPATRITIHAAD